MAQKVAVAVTERAAVRSAMVTFVTSTLPPLAMAAFNAVVTTDPDYSTFGAPEDAALYAACVVYMKRLIAQGASVGPALPFR